jgi:hypothetical protein
MKVDRNLCGAERRLISRVHGPDRQALSELLVALREEFLCNAEAPGETALKVAQAGAKVSEMQQRLEKTLRQGYSKSKKSRSISVPG